MYKFQDIERWSISWYTPNEFGLILVEVLFLVIWISGDAFCRSKHIRWLLAPVIGTVVVLTYSLCRTYSRGAWIAALCGLSGAAIQCYKLKVRQKGSSTALQAWNAVIIIAILCLIGFSLATGFHARLGTNMAMDASVLNRAKIWRAAPAMFASAPLTGWGTGSGAAVYSNWFQEPESPTTYISLVSSYLDLSLDHGFLLIFACVFASFWMLYLPYRVIASYDCINNDNVTGILRNLAANALGVAFVVANIPTSYVGKPWLAFLPFGLCIVLPSVELARHKIRDLLKPTLVITACSTGLILLLYIIGSVSIRNGPLAIKKTSATRGIICRSLATKHQIPIRIITDRTALGISPGKVIRQWLMAASPEVALETELYPFVERGAFDCSTLPQKIILIGSACRIDDTDRWGSKRILMLPSVPPPSTKPASITILLLPEADEFGLNESWLAWAQKFGIACKIVPNCGLVAIPTRINPLIL